MSDKHLTPEDRAAATLALIVCASFIVMALVGFWASVATFWSLVGVIVAAAVVIDFRGRTKP